MTIRKERFKAIALEVASDYGDTCDEGIVIHHAFALIKRVEAEVADYSGLAELPLVEE